MKMKPPEWVSQVPITENARIVLKALWFCVGKHGNVPASLNTLVFQTELLGDKVIKALWELQELKIICNKDPSKGDISDLRALVHFQLRFDMPPAMIREVGGCPE